ncbi:MAG: dihydroneopterin aldolase [Bacteroidetes bacterium GWE2_29_8]|nr:MAG: dihydroneopterin aldolase [Bacteroidetes bacterium GWE2_29_8]OFY21871.1 MAG: dihydroneopterin aldolase [Bacteroidetes bacterium GWF2_29_10]
MGLIEIEDIEVFAYHGCTESEKIIGGNFIVDISYKYNSAKAEENDDITLAVNYQDITNIAREEMRQTSNLIEHVCKRIFDKIKLKYNKNISYLKVTISKKNPPVGGFVKNVKFTKEENI